MQIIPLLEVLGMWFIMAPTTQDGQFVEKTSTWIYLVVLFNKTHHNLPSGYLP
jgi:hypothetical protein